MSQSSQIQVKLATQAMATRFELLLIGESEPDLRAAGQEAIREIDRIAKRFSFYDPTSELNKINQGAHVAPVKVSGDLFELLQLCDKMHAHSHGAFDPTVGPLMKMWDWDNTSSNAPSTAAIRRILDHSGWHRVHLDSAHYTVSFSGDQMAIDLGGIAKGWALDEAALLLRESGITAGLLHGGTSSVLSLGTVTDGDPWKIGIEDPYESGWFSFATLSPTLPALAVSAIHGKSVERGGIEYGHVIDPRTGLARSGPIVSAIQFEKAAEADAWATALIALDAFCKLDLPPMAASFLKTDAKWTIRSGSWPNLNPNH